MVVSTACDPAGLIAECGQTGKVRRVCAGVLSEVLCYFVKSIVEVL